MKPQPGHPHPSRATPPGRLFLALLAWAGVVTAAKVILAFKLDLFGDEAFYWLESQNPAWVYGDLPFMTAMLVKGGTLLLGTSPVGVRFLFLLLSLALPFAVYCLGKPVVGRANAGLAAVLIFLVPLPATLGFMALPDVPLAVLSIVGLALFERALRLGHWRYWLLTGLVGALGFCTHYRFVFLPFAIVVFLLVTSSGRRHWRNPRLWATAAIMSLGLLPVLVHNLQKEFAGVSYYFLDRHPWQFYAKGLLYLPEQAAVVGPVLFVLMLYALWLAWRRETSAGLQSAQLLAVIATTYLGVFTLLKPVVDKDLVSLHWTLPAWLILPVFLASALQAARRPRLTSGLALGSGFLWVGAVLVFGMTTAFHSRLPAGSRLPLATSMAGWNEMATRADELLRDGELVVTDNYYPAVYYRFHSEKRTESFSVGTRRALRHGRLQQLGWWNMDEDALKRRAPERALVIMERSFSGQAHYVNSMTRICRLFPQVIPAGTLELAAGRIEFEYFHAAAKEVGTADSGQSVCPQYLGLVD